MARTNRFKAAFTEQFNLVGLASTFTLSAIMATPLPFIVGMIAEAAYLLFVPDSRWYEQRMSKRFDAEVVERRRQLKEQTLPTLRKEMQSRFLRLEERRRQIESVTAQDESWFREILRKLDYLLEKFLLFAGKEKRFRTHLEGLLEEVRAEKRAGRGEARKENRRRSERRLELDLPPVPQESYEGYSSDTEAMVEQVQAAYDREMERIREAEQEEPDENTRLVLERRLEVLQRRHEFVGKIGKILTNLDHQMQLVEDTFGLINDEIRAQSPEQLTSDIDEVIVASNVLTTALEEVSSLEQMVARLGE
jgi:hypothetical protein